MLRCGSGRAASLKKGSLIEAFHEASIGAPMYKRNQVEWAIWQTLDRGRLTADDVPETIRNTLRRLIDVDRKLLTNMRAREEWQHRFAFIEGPPQGRGGENQFRHEEVVALWLSVQCLAVGLPQTEVIQSIRALKPSVDAAVARALARVQPRITAAVARGGPDARALRQRELLPANELIYLVTSSVAEQAASAHRSGSAFSKIIDAAKLSEVVEGYCRSAGRALVLEITNSAASLAYFLELSPRMRRGRRAAQAGD